MDITHIHDITVLLVFWQNLFVKGIPINANIFRWSKSVWKSRCASLWPESTNKLIQIVIRNNKRIQKNNIIFIIIQRFRWLQTVSHKALRYRFRNMLYNCAFFQRSIFSVWGQYNGAYNNNQEDSFVNSKESAHPLNWMREQNMNIIFGKTVWSLLTKNTE